MEAIIFRSAYNLSEMSYDLLHCLTTVQQLNSRQHKKTGASRVFGIDCVVGYCDPVGSWRHKLLGTRCDWVYGCGTARCSIIY